MTGFLLAGVGNVDLRRNTNYLVVNESEPSSNDVAYHAWSCDAISALSAGSSNLSRSEKEQQESVKPF